MLALLAIVALIVRRPTDFFMLVPFYLLLLIAASTLIRAVYFASLAAQVFGAGSNARDVALIELPTFLWFTAVTLIISFWVVLSQPRLHASGLLARVAVIFTIANVIMYAFLIAAIVVFARLEGSSGVVCRGRLSATNQRQKQHVVQVVYQALLAVVATTIGVAFAVVSIRSLRASESEPTRQLRQATYFGTLIAASFVLHAIYLLALAIASPGIPELALLILITEALPAAIIVFQMLHRYVSMNLSAFGSATDETSERAQYYSHSSDVDM